MTDIVCVRCRVPKPPVCYEHSGAHRDMCQPCYTRHYADTAAAWKRSRIGRESAKLSKWRRIERDSDAYADKVAAWAERKGAA